MMGIMQPIFFKDIDKLNEFYTSFLIEVKDICEKHDEIEYFDSIKIDKDEKNLNVVITKMGTYGSNQNDEKAHNEILSAFKNKIISK